jgi:hypothetical protein
MEFSSFSAGRFRAATKVIEVEGNANATKISIQTKKKKLPISVK